MSSITPANQRKSGDSKSGANQSKPMVVRIASRQPAGTKTSGKSAGTTTSGKSAGALSKSSPTPPGDRSQLTAPLKKSVAILAPLEKSKRTPASSSDKQQLSPSKNPSQKTDSPIRSGSMKPALLKQTKLPTIGPNGRPVLKSKPSKRKILKEKREAEFAEFQELCTRPSLAFGKADPAFLEFAECPSVSLCNIGISLCA